MDSELRSIIQQIHDCHTQAAVVVTGAGTQALAWLFGVAGASRTMLEARVPYAATAFQDFIVREPKKYASRRSARLLAGNALQRATFLAEDRSALIGIGCTATISTDYVKRGEHKAHIAVWRREQITTYNLKLAKGKRNRAGEEKVVSRLIVAALAEACGLEHTIDLKVTKKDQLEISKINIAHSVGSLLDGRIPFIVVHADGRIKTEGVNPQGMLAGSFNPLHEAHRQLAAVAARFLGQPVAFELAAVNVDKPPLPKEVVLNRLVQFAGRHPLYLTAVPTFIEKIRLFPHTTFVVGYDTAVRVFDPRFYNGSHEGMVAALTEIRALGGRFLVVGRANTEGNYHAAAELAPPADFADLFIPLPPELFRLDISSTAIRRSAGFM